MLLNLFSFYLQSMHARDRLFWSEEPFNNPGTVISSLYQIELCLEHLPTTVIRIVAGYLEICDKCQYIFSEIDSICKTETWPFSFITTCYHCAKVYCHDCYQKHKISCSLCKKESGCPKRVCMACEMNTCASCSVYHIREQRLYHWHCLLPALSSNDIEHVKHYKFIKEFATNSRYQDVDTERIVIDPTVDKVYTPQEVLVLERRRAQLKSQQDNYTFRTDPQPPKKRLTWRIRLARFFGL